MHKTLVLKTLFSRVKTVTWYTVPSKIKISSLFTYALSPRTWKVTFVWKRTVWESIEIWAITTPSLFLHNRICCICWFTYYCLLCRHTEAVNGSFHNTRLYGGEPGCEDQFFMKNIWACTYEMLLNFTWIPHNVFLRVVIVHTIYIWKTLYWNYCYLVDQNYFCWTIAL